METLALGSGAIAVVALRFTRSLRFQVIALREQVEDLEADVTRWMRDEAALEPGPTSRDAGGS